MRHRPARADRDADVVRDDRTRYVAEHLGTPDGVLIVDETGFLKKGVRSCGVARRYTGTAGRIASARGGVPGVRHPEGAGPDRPGVVPADGVVRGHRPAAGGPAAVGFATTIALARRVVERAVAAGVTARWVTADAVYGSGYHVHIALENEGLGYVVGARTDVAVASGWRRVRAKAPLAQVPADGWHRLSGGAGAKGPRRYGWAPRRTNSPEPDTFARWLLIRRSVSDPAAAAHFACGGPPATTRPARVRVAGLRWAVEECFALAKGDGGLDGHEVRPWTGRHWHVTLSPWARAVVAVIRSRVAKPGRREKGAAGWSG